jgi:hypothetical protein
VEDALVAVFAKPDEWRDLDEEVPVYSALRVARAELRAALAAPCLGPPAAPSEESWARECLEMIREDLEAYGLSMQGCPPMMYNDAIRSLVARLGKRAGLATVAQVRDVVLAAERGAPPPEAP